ncbi:MAG: methylisocitrate lyase [Planctomycetota bacterium]|nr:methylisocitrate lyase [Planctomycetota bacterium]
MPGSHSAGQRFRRAVEEERPLQLAGTINAYCARLAERAGFRAIYLSGAGVANASLGLPDLGMTTLADVLDDARRITAATSLPLLVDCDTGWGSPLTIARTVREMIQAGVAAIHLEDQIDAKRCGHRRGKQLVTTTQMQDRLKAAVDARTDPGFVIMARTDAVAVEGLDAAIARAGCYVEAGADMIFAEALTDLNQFGQFSQAVAVPVLANMTEFGKSPLLTLDELAAAGIRLVLYPLTAFRAMSAAAEQVYDTLRNCGTQSSLLDTLQSRDELYEVLDYYKYEQQLDSRTPNPTSQAEENQP